jgi:hypothetical protein
LWTKVSSSLCPLPVRTKNGGREEQGRVKLMTFEETSWDIQMLSGLDYWLNEVPKPRH